LGADDEALHWTPASTLTGRGTDPLSIDENGAAIDKLLSSAVIGFIAAQGGDTKEELDFQGSG
jgi:hypothetical protein